MKLAIKTLVVLMLAEVVASANPIFWWGSTQGLLLDPVGGDVYDRNGQLVSQDSDWLVELINVADDTVLFSINDGFIWGDGLFLAGEQGAVDAEAWNGLTVKTVIFDAPVKEDAGFFAEFSAQYSVTWDTGSALPPTIEDYDTGSLAAGDWQAIPEPAVASFIVIFGGAMLASRRIFKKS